ncbi:glycine oxidase ThiO [Brevibacillus dissolubilis]|uniref:glycine oxidase ThiO n=1 Tax=Brevibacillus dissolubilis TaxID=1844116 RepID=UPI0021004D3D|nr:glycine oxidase ThiO [Brevibacillus dissolubilis]
MNQSQTDFLIIGGGVIGLSLAYELGRRGAKVTLLEQGEWGGQASSAAAGMLAPLKEYKEPGANLDLGMKSLQMYPEWVRELRELSGVDPQLAMRGVMTIAMDESEAKMWHDKYQWQKAAGYPVEWVGQEDLRKLEPALNPDTLGAIYSPTEGDVNNVLLLQALLLACQKIGVQLIQGAVATKLLTGHNETKIRGVETTQGKLYAEQTIITAGAWAGVIAGWLGLTVPIFPVRGQIAAVSAGSLELRHVIFGAQGYLVPKQDNRIVIGATEDQAGFRREVSMAGLASVLTSVLPYVPSIGEATFLRAWAGLRPGTVDGLPMLGPIGDYEGLAMASGHYRNGILLSPVTARTMADWLLTGDRSGLTPFLPERFFRGQVVQESEPAV